MNIAICSEIICMTISRDLKSKTLHFEIYTAFYFYFISNHHPIVSPKGYTKCFAESFHFQFF